MEEYEYAPLEEGSIRLLKIHRNLEHDGGTAVFELIHLTRTERETALYEALSYVWGSTERPCTLNLIHGQRISTTRTLSSALPYLAASSTTGFLWIDQLCINQFDNVEKSAQVPMMGDIYAGADRTIAWLGLSSHDMLESISRFPKISQEMGRWASAQKTDTVSIEGLQELCSVFQSDPPSNSLGLLALINSLSSTEREALIPCAKGMGFEVTGVLTPDIIHFCCAAIQSAAAALELGCANIALDMLAVYRLISEPVMNLIGNDYCRRVWTIQEVWMSRKFACQIASLQFDPADITCCAWVSGWCRIIHKSALLISAGSKATWMSRVLRWTFYFAIPRQTRHRYTTNYFADYLTDRRTGMGLGSTLASKPQDLIYGLLAVPGQQSVVIKPDYSKTVAEVFTTAARYHILANQSLEALQYCDSGTHVAGIIVDGIDDWRLPSWVPDYRRTTQIAPLLGVPNPWLSNSGRASELYSVLGSSNEDLPQLFMACSNAPLSLPGLWSTRLSLKGRIVDHVDTRLAPWQRQLLGYLGSSIFEGGLGKTAQLYELLSLTAQNASRCPGFLDSVNEKRLLTMAVHGRLLRYPQHTDIEELLRTWADPTSADAARRREIAGCYSTLTNRVYATTREVRLCLAPDGVQPGDVIAILHGSRSPMVLRRSGTDADTYQLLGECYLEGAMFGELKTWADGEADDFVLV